MPVAIALGWLLAAVLLGTLEIWEAAVLGTMLAPTDAALGKAVVSNERVPIRIRQALNIESGLNDGISLPLFLVFLETALVAEDSLAISEIVVTLLEQVGIAIIVGIAVGWIGAIAIRWGRSSGAALGYWLEIGLVGLAVGAYAIATPLGGSGFIAAWVAGYVFGTRFVSVADDPLPEFAEALGDLLTMASFFVFGIFLGPVLVDLSWQIVLYGVLSLAAVRMIAVAVALIGEKMRWQSVLYIGWFGPRGLATIILTIEVIDESTLNGASTIADAALFTVALSVLLHGVTAWWGSNTYADYCRVASETDRPRRGARAAEQGARPLPCAPSAAGPSGAAEQELADDLCLRRTARSSDSADVGLRGRLGRTHDGGSAISSSPRMSATPRSPAGSTRECRSAACPSIRGPGRRCRGRASGATWPGRWRRGRR